MTATEAEALLAGLDDEQRRAAEAVLGPVCLLAGAGTGKTRAITHRIAYGIASGVYSPGRVMALTFTSRSAAELRSRLRQLGAPGVAARTFHSAALAQLSFFWPQIVGGTLPKVLESKGRLIGHAADTLGIRVDTAALRDVAAEIEWRKVSGLSIEQYELAAFDRPLPGSLTPDSAAALHRSYEELKDARRQLDFEDVLLATAGMIDQEPQVAEQVREQYRFFVVDEYQDVSPLQQQLLELWLGERSDVCVVGDASQTVYSFAGATADYLLNFPRRYPEAAVIRLEQNYRSSPEIVGAANRLMRGRPGALSLHPHAGNPAGPELEVRQYPTDAAEARGVAASVADLIAEGHKPQSIAVLYRINAQAAALETALGDLGVSYTVRGSARFFEQREVREAMMMLRGASISVVGEPLFKSVSDVLRTLGWTQQPPEAPGAGRSRWESLDALMSLAEQTPDGTTLRQFVDELAERQAAQHEPTLEAVALATLHSAKGLEWDTVLLAGVSEGLLPISYAKGLAAIDEERRLLYVGVTRARHRLQLSWSLTGPHRSAERSPSRFLAEIGGPARSGSGSLDAAARRVG